MDLQSISSLLSSITAATEIAKLIKSSDATLEKAEAKLKMAELISALADVKLQAAEIQQAIIDRDERIRLLEAQIQRKKSLTWREPCYFITSDEGLEEPFCQQCYDASQNLSRLHSDGQGLYSCRVCNKSFRTKERVQRDDAALRVPVRRSTPWSG